MDVKRSAVAAAVVCLGLCSAPARAQEEPAFTSEFQLENCDFTLKSQNPYFPLKPGFVRSYAGESDGELVELVITVENRTRTVSLPIGGELRKVKTRVVEEHEQADGELVEISRNFFAVCRQTGDVFYFGEEVDIYEDGEIVSHDGAWLAGRDGARPGILMPGRFLLGARYFQEIAPNALDRAEHVEDGLGVDVIAGSFEGCARIAETTPLEPGAESEKLYCPGVGLAIDGPVELVEFGKRRGRSRRD